MFRLLFILSTNNWPSLSPSRVPCVCHYVGSPTPSNTPLTEKPPARKTSDIRDRVDESLRYLLPQDSNVPYDMKHVVSKVEYLMRLSIVNAIEASKQHRRMKVGGGLFGKAMDPVCVTPDESYVRSVANTAVHTTVGQVATLRVCSGSTWNACMHAGKKLAGM